MKKVTHQAINGVLLAVIVLAGSIGGGVIYLEKTDDYVNCRGEWTLEDNGMFRCERTGELQYCWNVTYRGSGWYRCFVGLPVDIKIENPIEVAKKGRYHCTKYEGCVLQ